MYIIQCRYEYLVNGGEKKVSKWYNYDTKPKSEGEANESLKAAKESTAKMDKVTKLKHEYQLLPYEEYEKSHKQLLKEVEKKKVDFAKIPRMKKPWLRKKKTTAKKTEA